MTYKLFYILLFLPVLYFGVFSISFGAIYVVNDDDNLCGEFKRGNSEKANWLQKPWYAVSKSSELNEKFFSAIDCENTTADKCCRSLGYRYAGIPVGIEIIGLERKSAEFLASKSIIESQSLFPSRYNLESNITRKEVMKVIINTSGVELDQTCRKIFSDVENDWGCKYIETALDKEFITGNDQFRPNGLLTRSEALKLIFNARNINTSYSSNSWQDNYISTALYLGLIDTKFSDYNMSATRGWIFGVLAKTYPDFKNY